MTEFALFGTDLFGEPVTRAAAPLASRFVVPPFSVLDARQGDWQERKRAWLTLGIESEIGRGENIVPNGTIRTPDQVRTPDQDGAYMRGFGKTFNTDGNIAGNWTGTSIFDPVLCELAYRWFCPDGGQIVDPFAGGSVRGIVAALLGNRYWGCDLRQEQIDANVNQANDIIGATVEVKISAAMLRQPFHSCTADFITETCQGRCCQGSGGIKVTVHATEMEKFKDKGAVINGGFIEADSRGLCPFKTDDGFCSIHDDKPFGCRASPFTLNPNDTLIVRNRYRLLKCYDCAGSQPAYKAHAWSISQIFGDVEADRIARHLDNGGGDLTAEMSADHYAMLKDNDAAKGTKVDASMRPVWRCGDAMDLLADAPPCDLVFTCPPYGDLERYSDDPLDLSTMEYHTFIAAYKRIILRCSQKLRRGGMACFVVGDFRDKKTGNYRGFVADTINAFREVGMHLYNDAILVTAVGSLPIRVGKQFEASRKLGKTHQNVLVFRK